MKKLLQQNMKHILSVVSMFLFLMTCLCMTEPKAEQQSNSTKESTVPIETIGMHKKTQETGFLTGSIRIAKRIRVSELEEKKHSGEEPTFLFWIDEFNLEGKWIRRICKELMFDEGCYVVDRDGYASTSCLIDRLSRGTYRVCEVGEGMDQFDRCGSFSSNGVLEGNTVVFEIGEESSAKDVMPNGEAVFVSRKELNSYDSQKIRPGKDIVSL